MYSWHSERDLFDAIVLVRGTGHPNETQTGACCAELDAMEVSFGSVGISEYGFKVAVAHCPFAAVFPKHFYF